MNIRPAEFAGSWYPDQPDDCERKINRFIKEGAGEPGKGEAKIGGIVPHAGWHFSGAIAANVIHQLRAGLPPEVFLIFGMHLHPNSPGYIMAEGAWETPFGSLPIAEDVAAALTERFDFVIETPSRHARDNTIELQLPFIKYFFGDAAIVPMGVPPHALAMEIGEAAVDIARSRNRTLRILGSTDLTHYGPGYGFAPKGQGPAAVKWVREENDRRIVEAIEAMDPAAVIRQGLTNQNACCAGAAAAAIAAGRRMGARRAEKLVYASSYDKSPGESFVGYVGAVF